MGSFPVGRDLDISSPVGSCICIPQPLCFMACSAEPSVYTCVHWVVLYSLSSISCVRAFCCWGDRFSYLSMPGTVVELLMARLLQLTACMCVYMCVCTYVCMHCLYVGVDYTYIDINALAQGIKSFLASQVWFQAVAGARTYGTDSPAITSHPR